MSVAAEVLQRRLPETDEKHARMFSAIIDAIGRAETSPDPHDLIGWQAWIIDVVDARDQSESLDALIEAGYRHVLFLRDAKVQASIPGSREDWARMNVVPNTEDLKERLAREA